MLNELVGVGASLAFARVSEGMGASPRSRYGGEHLTSRANLRRRGEHAHGAITG
jgi:hypothetical protein